DKYYKGRRPNGIYIPRFRNLGGSSDRSDFLRGYGYQGQASRGDWSEAVQELSYGKERKKAVLEPGGWTMGMTAFGETLPDHKNRMYMDYDKKDEWGLPTVTFDADFGENELAMRVDMKEQAAEMLEATGFKNISTYDSIGGMGLGIHEMGTARMGKDPKTSVLNKHNQLHDVPNVYVTDGAFMTSSACHNPSLGYMAFTARAASHAVEELKKMNLSFNVIMDRRRALRNIGLTTGVVAASPALLSLLQSCTAEKASWIPEFFTPEEGIVLTNIVDIIIPKTDTPSASEVNV